MNAIKFLVIQRVKPNVPLEVLVRLTPAQFKYLEDLKTKGKIESLYHMIGQQGYMIIYEAESDEALSKLISEDPMFFHSQREVYPLTSLEKHKKYLREILPIRKTRETGLS